MSFLYERHNKYPDKILFRRFVENVCVDDIIDSWSLLLQNKLLDNTIVGVINNLTCCELTMNLNSFKKLILFLKSNERLKRLKLAVIVNDTFIRNFPLKGEKEKELQIKPFDNEDDAVDWLLQHN